MSQEEPTLCELCTKIIFLEDDAAHFNCVTNKEKHLIEMVSALHSQVIAMKRSFTAVEGVLKDLGIALNINYSSEDDRVPPRRNIRQSAKEKTRQVAEIVTTKRSSSRRAVSPLAVPNGTSQSSDIVVSVSQKRTNVSRAPSPKSAPPTTSASVLVEVNDDDTSGTSSQPAEQQTNIQIDDGCGLPVVPPPKSIFLSRIGFDVTTDQVHSYIMSKVQGAENLTVRKLLFREPRNFSSFEIKVGNDLNLFNAILAPAMWPQHSVAHEFKRFLRDRRAYSNLQ